MWRSFTQVLSVLLVILSSIFLVRAALSLSTKDIVMLSETKWGYSLDAASSLCHQRADTIVGTVILLLSLIPQFTEWWFFTGIDFAMNKKGMVAAFAIVIILYFIAAMVADKLYSNKFIKVKNVLTLTVK